MFFTFQTLLSSISNTSRRFIWFICHVLRVYESLFVQTDSQMPFSLIQNNQSFSLIIFLFCYTIASIVPQLARSQIHITLDQIRLDKQITRMQRPAQRVSLRLEVHPISVRTGESHFSCGAGSEITLECQIGLFAFGDWKPNNTLLSFLSAFLFPFWLLKISDEI